MISKKIVILNIIFIAFFISCKDSSRSNTGALEYDKLMNKKDIILESNEEDNEESEKKVETAKKKTDFKTDVQVIKELPAKKEYSERKQEEYDRFLIATKLCWGFNYKNTFGEIRKGNYKNNKERIKISSCCASFIPSPYISPLEYYYSKYYENKDIITYQNNVFKLKEIRENLVSENFESFKSKVEKSETKNIESFSITSSKIQNYDLQKRQLEIRYYINNNIRIGNTYARVKSSGNKFSSSVTHFISMSETQAKKIYEHYESLNEYNKNPPFNLITKTTYTIRIPKVEKRPYNFEININKIEFFKSSEGYPEPTDEIGEIQFIK